MRIRIKLLYFLLIGLLVVNVILVAGYLYLTKRKDAEILPTIPKKHQVALQKPEVVFESKFKELDVALDKRKTFELLQDAKFLKGYMAVNLTTLREYNPKRIVIAFHEEENFQGLPLLQRFKIGGKVAYGYEVVQDNEQYRLNFYFNPKHLTTLKREDLDYTLNSALVKAIVRLAALHEKKSRLSSEEERAALRKAVDYLEKFRLVYVRGK